MLLAVGGGGYYGGGGAADEVTADAGGAGGGSGFLNTSVGTLISTTNGGALNGDINWVWRASAVTTGDGRMTGHNGVDYPGPTGTSMSDAQMTTYRTDGRTISSRNGGNGWVVIKKIS